MDLDKPQKVIILTVIGVLMLSLVNSISTLGNLVTREEAIEISKNSELVKEGLAMAHSFSVDATYYNSSMVEQMKLGHNKELYEKVPEGHGVWCVIWWFIYKTKPGGYNVIVIVDAETGVIIHEAAGIAFF